MPHANPTRSELTAFHATTPRGLLGRGRVETRRGQYRDTCFPMPRRPRSPTRAATACSAPAPFRAERIWRVLKAIWRSAAEDVRAYTPHVGRRCLTGANGLQEWGCDSWLGWRWSGSILGRVRVIV